MSQSFRLGLASDGLTQPREQRVYPKDALRKIRAAKCSRTKCSFFGTHCVIEHAHGTCQGA